MSDYREECIRRKNVQRGIEDERSVGTKKKAGKRPYLMEYRTPWRSEWRWRGRYLTAETANQAFDLLTRKHPDFGFRLMLNGEQLRIWAGSGSKVT